ncbi:MAG: hypothetical protein Q8P83_01480 [bacterium]|nr:hypothetical protein [bacterium]
MDPRPELVATNQKQVLEFFIVGLEDVSEPDVDRKLLLYNASVLAHYAQVSTQSADEWPAPKNLSTLFDYFVLDNTLLHDGEMMEIAGAQCLLLAGFFEDQMRRHHSIQWYSELGASFFRRAAERERTTHKAELLLAIAQTFEPWRRRHARLSRELHDQRYLLTLPESQRPS